MSSYREVLTGLHILLLYESRHSGGPILYAEPNLLLVADTNNPVSWRTREYIEALGWFFSEKHQLWAHRCPKQNN